MYSRILYIANLVLFAVALFITYIPGLEGVCSWVTPPFLLFMGLLFALLCGQPFPEFNKKCSKMLLQYSVVGLGFGMNLGSSLASGASGMAFTIVSVFGTLVLGWVVGRRLLKVDRNTSYLVSTVGPIINAKGREMSVALGTVFILNAVALFIFPVIGRALGLSDADFGTWAAIAIHDTSSVVGAGAAYSEAALEVATTIKLTRALWIIPVAIFTAFLFRSKGRKVAIPWFILWFIVAMVVNTYLLDSVPQVGRAINGIARKCLTLTMFFIGASLSVDVLKQVGIKPLLQGILLLVLVSVGSLLYIILV